MHPWGIAKGGGHRGQRSAVGTGKPWLFPTAAHVGHLGAEGRDMLAAARCRQKAGSQRSLSGRGSLCLTLDTVPPASSRPEDSHGPPRASVSLSSPQACGSAGSEENRDPAPGHPSLGLLSLCAALGGNYWDPTWLARGRSCEDRDVKGCQLPFQTELAATVGTSFIQTWARGHPPRPKQLFLPGYLPARQSPERQPATRHGGWHHLGPHTPTPMQHSLKMRRGSQAWCCRFKASMGHLQRACLRM